MSLVDAGAQAPRPAPSTGSGSGIGASVLRREDPEALLGRACYVDDLDPPGVLSVAFVRSPHAHARLRTVQTEEARALPGVHSVLTGEGVRARSCALHPKRYLPGLPDIEWWALPTEKVRHVGAPVAAVLADDRYLAEDGAELVQVEYEALPPVVDAVEALEPTAPRLFEEWGTNELLHVSFNGGNVEAAFAEADLVIDGAFRHHRCTGVPLETRGCLARWDSSRGSLEMWSSTQSPQVLRWALAEALNLPEDSIRVVAPRVGGGFGNKQYVVPEEITVALLAREHGRPVKWVEDRWENLAAGVHSQEQTHDVQVAVRQDGRLLGMRAQLVADAGDPVTYVSGVGPATVAARFLPGPYDVPAYAYDLRCVVTNKCPMGAYRSYGHQQASFTRERLLDRIARKLNIDPAEIRRRNLVTDFPYQAVNGAIFDSGDYVGLLQKALEAVDYAGFRAEQQEARARGRYIGLGLAAFVEGAGPVIGPAGARWESADTVRLRLEQDGSVRVWLSITSQGQGAETMVSQVVADRLGVPLDSIEVVHGDTAEVPTGRGTFGSRGTMVAGGGAHVAAGELRNQILAAASGLFEAVTEDLEIVDGRVRLRGTESSARPLSDVAAAGALEAVYTLPEPHGWPRNSSGAFSSAVHLATVEVDIATGFLTILRYIVAHDCGTVVNPLIVQGQIEGGVAQGVGSALYESMVYDEGGQPLTASLMDYLIPTVPEALPVELHHLETPALHVPGGFKGMGESGTVGPPAALGNAVEDALAPLGVQIDVPLLSPSVILEALAGAGVARQVCA